MVGEMGDGLPDVDGDAPSGEGTERRSKAENGLLMGYEQGGPVKCGGGCDGAIRCFRRPELG